MSSNRSLKNSIITKNKKGLVLFKYGKKRSFLGINIGRKNKPLIPIYNQDNNPFLKSDIEFFPGSQNDQYSSLQRKYVDKINKMKTYKEWSRLDDEKVAATHKWLERLDKPRHGYSLPLISDIYRLMLGKQIPRYLMLQHLSYEPTSLFEDIQNIMSEKVSFEEIQKERRNTPTFNTVPMFDAALINIDEVFDPQKLSFDLDEIYPKQTKISQTEEKQRDIQFPKGLGSLQFVNYFFGQKDFIIFDKMRNPIQINYDKAVHNMVKNKHEQLRIFKPCHLEAKYNQKEHDKEWNFSTFKMFLILDIVHALIETHGNKSQEHQFMTSRQILFLDMAKNSQEFKEYIAKYKKNLLLTIISEVLDFFKENPEYQYHKHLFQQRKALISSILEKCNQLLKYFNLELLCDKDKQEIYDNAENNFFDHDALENTTNPLHKLLKLNLSGHDNEDSIPRPIIPHNALSDSSDSSSDVSPNSKLPLMSFFNRSPQSIRDDQSPEKPGSVRFHCCPGLEMFFKKSISKYSPSHTDSGQSSDSRNSQSDLFCKPVIIHR